MKTPARRRPFKVFIVDDHPLLREGLIHILENEKDLQVCGEAADHHEALAQLPGLSPDLVLMDISLSGTSGIELTKTIRNRYPKLPILVFSVHSEMLYADRALRVGASGYIMKKESRAELLSAMRQVLQGHVYLSKVMNDAMLQKVAGGKTNPALSFSVHSEMLYADRALRVGASGYIMKKESRAELLSAMRQVLQGHVYLSKVMNDAMLQKVAGGKTNPALSPVENLSDREFEIFQLIGEGYGTRQMADKLSVSIKTVETHREHIREKLNLKTTFELVQQAIHWIHGEKER